MSAFTGCASWSIPKQYSGEFPEQGSHLSRYAARLNAVEINSSFHRPHRHSTYARWADSTPIDFRFSVKMPRQITHELGLRDFDQPLSQFLCEIQGLGDKLGPVLVQLPPRLKWDVLTAGSFFGELRCRIATPIVCEPRHISWFKPDVDEVFTAHGISRVIADPPVKDTEVATPLTGALSYFRLHGSPRIYYSSYSDTFLTTTARRFHELIVDAQAAWCIFDNTASGAAIENALTLRAKLAFPVN